MLDNKLINDLVDKIKNENGQGHALLERKFNSGKISEIERDIVLMRVALNHIKNKLDSILNKCAL